MHAAVQTALDRAFPGMRYSAAAAIHTRKHHRRNPLHVHVVVAKFAQTDKGAHRLADSKAGAMVLSACSSSSEDGRRESNVSSASGSSSA